MRYSIVSCYSHNTRDSSKNKVRNRVTRFPQWKGGVTHCQAHHPAINQLAGRGKLVPK